MKKALLSAKNALIMSLILISCKPINPYVFDTEKGEVLRQNGDDIERYSCFDEKLNRFACFNQKDLQIINKCLKRCQNKK